jgi:hypothetical protein
MNWFDQIHSTRMGRALVPVAALAIGIVIRTVLQ